MLRPWIPARLGSTWLHYYCTPDADSVVVSFSVADGERKHPTVPLAARGSQELTSQVSMCVSNLGLEQGTFPTQRFQTLPSSLPYPWHPLQNVILGEDGPGNVA